MEVQNPWQDQRHEAEILQHHECLVQICYLLVTRTEFKLVTEEKKNEGKWISTLQCRNSIVCSIEEIHNFITK
jgi:hypothetical protein